MFNIPTVITYELTMSKKYLIGYRISYYQKFSPFTLKNKNRKRWSKGILHQRRST